MENKSAILQVIGIIVLEFTDFGKNLALFYTDCTADDSCDDDYDSTLPDPCSGSSCSGKSKLHIQLEHTNQCAWFCILPASDSCDDTDSCDEDVDYDSGMFYGCEFMFIYPPFWHLNLINFWYFIDVHTDCDGDLAPGEGEAVWEEEAVDGGIEIVEECPDDDTGMYGRQLEWIFI